MDYSEMTLVGRAAKDTVFTSGDPSKNLDDRASLTLAVNRPGKSGKCDFFYVVAWGPLARVLKDYSYKGKGLLLRGVPQTYEKEVGGQKITQVELRVEHVTLGEDTQDKRGTREATRGPTKEEIQQMVLDMLGNQNFRTPEPEPDYEYTSDPNAF